MKILRKLLQFHKKKSQNNIIQNPYTFKHVEHYYWKPKNGEINFGDHLAHVIITKILSDNGHVIEEETSHDKRLLSLGSILHFARNADVIWGTGLNGKIESNQYKFQRLDVRAVREPLTRDFLLKKRISTPEVYGDPAILLPQIFPGRFERSNIKKYVTVPNLHDLELAKQKRWKNLISPLSSWNKCVERILEAEFVIASSLHGLIVAEAFGIPTRYVRLTETESLLKYNDYMLDLAERK
jgi:pyruvyltransferase